MKKAVESGVITQKDKYRAQLDEAFKSLEVHTSEKSPVLKIHQVELNGLAGITGMPRRNVPSLFQTKSPVVSRLSGLPAPG